ncbi:MAG: DUF1640 domain-containing protein [Magnetococcales bacterium]|nr:DUF1640 domain-containing protein [Magnetococcales bacterium]
MTTITFDPLEFTEQLKASGVLEQQAKGHAKAMAGVLGRVEEARHQELATKGDILRLEKEIGLAKAELRKEIETAKSETIKWMFGVAAGQAVFIVTLLKLFK